MTAVVALRAQAEPGALAHGLPVPGAAGKVQVTPFKRLTDEPRRPFLQSKQFRIAAGTVVSAGAA